MEDHFDKLLYLVVGLIYFFLKNSNSRNADKPTVTDKPSGQQPAPVARTNWPDTWVDEAQEEPVVKKPLLQTAIKEVSPHPGHAPTTRLAAPQLTDKKIDRVLRRYGGWQKALIMGELIQPYS